MEGRNREARQGTCERCGRNLKHAVAVGSHLFGYICAGKAKGQPVQKDLFKADWDIVACFDDVVYIRDLDNGNMSVTNDAVNVVAEILKNAGPARRIVYRDSEGRWDELQHDGTRFTRHAPWFGWNPEKGEATA